MANTVGAVHIPKLDIFQSSHLAYMQPLKKINEGQDVSHFLQTKAYTDLMTFLLQLNRAMFPCLPRDEPKAWEIGSPRLSYSNAVKTLQALLRALDEILNETPPDAGPRRFGNYAFRKWYQIVEDRASELLSMHLPSIPKEAHIELSSYFLGSFGSAQRLDYGSGHELSFLAFLGCIWKLGGFPVTSTPEDENRAIVLGIIQPYLTLIRRLIKTYNLEPAGSHGVWGLDDHSFLPYIFGSAQYGPPILYSTDQIPTEGSLSNSPDPGDVVSADRSARHKDTNMYFSAIAFIHDVKKGPFWEHSPMLFDISGVRGGWGKINKGMLKMYNAEVLSKFPVVQHFRFGALFSWERDPDAPEPPASVHTANQPGKEGLGGSSLLEKAAARGPPATMQAPWANANVPVGLRGEGTKAPWATKAETAPSRGMPPTRIAATDRKLRDPMAEEGPSNESGMMPPPTRAPWARPP